MADEKRQLSRGDCYPHPNPSRSQNQRTGEGVGLALVDISTGEFATTQIDGADARSKSSSSFCSAPASATYPHGRPVFMQLRLEELERR